ncbi:MAG: hypothetical protein JW904_02030 [Spirochaetales bacterium]|nr:hypothetical protein [Spirochaetales bacterium]
MEKKGFEYYQQKDYLTASIAFKQAIVYDSLNFLPHYNLACMLTLLYQEKQRVDTEEIYEELRICLGLDPVYAEAEKNFLAKRLPVDTDLKSIQ